MASINHPHILLVEDEPEGILYRDTLEKSLGVGVLLATTGREAGEVAESHTIKVAVIDQVLEPGMTGTELWSKIKRLHPRCRAILLSSKCEPSDVGRAMDLGFSKFLDKVKDIARLPQCVGAALQEFDLDGIAGATHTDRRPLFRFGPSIRLLRSPFEVHLVNRVLLDPRHVFSDRWEEKASVEAGKDAVREVTINLSRKTEMEYLSTSDVGAKASIDQKLLTERLGAELMAHRLESTTESVTGEAGYTCRVSISMKLPPIPEVVGTDYLASKSFQVNQVFEKYMCRVDVTCPCCHHADTNYRIVYVPTPLVAKRQIDTYSSGIKKVIDAGVVKQSQ